MPCYTKQRMVSVTAQYLLVPKVRMIFVTSVDFEKDKSIFFHSATMLVSATPSFLQSSAFPKSRLKFWAVLFYVCLDPRSWSEKQQGQDLMVQGGNLIQNIETGCTKTF